MNFGYDGSGRLTSITNAVGMADRFGYDAQGMITNLITAYGTNSFKATTNSFGATNLGGTNQVNRSLEVTLADGSKELYLYRDHSAKLNPGSGTDLIPTSYPGGEVPGTSPLSNTFDNSYMDARNTFSWNPLRYSLLSPAFRTNNLDFNQLTLTDHKYATLKHWSRDSGSNVKPVLSLRRDASPDGTVNGQTATLYGDQTFARAGFTVSPSSPNTFTAVAQGPSGSDTNAVTLKFKRVTH